MKHPVSLCLFVTALVLAVARPVWAQDADDDGDEPAKPNSELVVTARRLDAARANVVPALGATTYSINSEMVENRPGNEAISLGKVLLLFPGAQADGSGQLHIRGAQGDLQYRINDVIIPDGASDLGESLSARIAQKITLVTGALPAQYGFQTGGVVNVTTKTGAYLDGGQIEAYGGGRGDSEIAEEFGASAGASNLFLSSSFQRKFAGLAAPDGSSAVRHDRSDQSDVFAYMDQVLNPHTRVGLILSLSDDRFQIPDLRGLTSRNDVFPGAPFKAPLTVDGISDATSEALADSRRESNRFAVASLMHSSDKLTIQLAAYGRDSVTTQSAAGVADILFKGLGLASRERGQTAGGQAEAVIEAADAHTLRLGLQGSWERLTAMTTTLALPIDGAGFQLSDTPLSRPAGEAGILWKASAFVQDEWRLGGDVTLNLGGRLDAVHGQRAEQAFSPRISLVWLTPSGATFHAGYARYFLPAPLDLLAEQPDALAGTTAATPTTTGQALRSEHDDYVDVGLQRGFDHLTIGVDAYDRRASNLIVEGLFGPAALPETFNYTRADFAGLELTATYADGPLTGWTNLALARSVGRGIVSNQFYFTSDQLMALAVSDRPLNQDQRMTASGGGAYRLGRVTVSASLVIGSGSPRTAVGGVVNGAHLPAYAQADFSVDYHMSGLGKRPLEAHLDLINASDARYRLRDGTGLGDGMAAWGPRRGIFLGLEQNF